jgi:hypothetical protein
VMYQFFVNSGTLPLPFHIGIGAIALAAVLVMIGVLWWAQRRDREVGSPHAAQLDRLTDGATLVTLVWIGGFVTMIFFEVTSDWPLWPWYFYHSLIVGLIAPGIILAALWQTVPLPRLAWRADGLAVRSAIAVVALVLALGVGTVAAKNADGSENFYTQAALAAMRLNRSLPRDAVVAMGDRAGAFGYVLDRPVVQLEGIVNDAAFIDARRTRHVHDFLRASHVDYFARSLYMPDARKASPARCQIWKEPRFGPRQDTNFLLCPRGIVYESHLTVNGEQLVLWRYTPPPRR